MNERTRRVLVLDTDPETLIPLQQVLEQAEIDTTITWDEMEAWQLLGDGGFDLLLVGDHPPELDAAAILNNLSFRGTCPPVFILRGIIGEKDAEFFRRCGAVGVVPRRDSVAVLDQVTKALAPTQLRAKAGKTRLMEARSWRAAS